ncbi:adenylyltransferase/cytidyltransferase family protein [Cyclobacterium sediminis]|jgi:cytidyltransferase-like protein
MKTIYAKMVADLLHPGHISFLKQAKSLGDRLVVHVVSDERVRKVKRCPIMNQSERAIMLASCKYVDEVRLDGPREIDDGFLIQNGYDLFAYGYVDDKEMEIKAKEYRNIPEHKKRVIPYSHHISTTLIIDRIRKGLKEH